MSINLQIAFFNKYNYPESIDDNQFKVIPLPKEWAMDGVEITDLMLDELPKFINKPSLNRTLKPHEKYVFAIGTLYPIPAKISGVLPDELFTQDKINLYHDCQSPMSLIKSDKLELRLGLKLKVDEICTTIPCGQISYLDQ